MGLMNQAKGQLVRTLLAAAAEKCYCTAAVTTGQRQGILLSRKLSRLGLTEPNAVKETVDEWVKNGNIVKRHDIIICVNYLRKANKYLHALQLHEWMEKGHIQMNNADRAIHIDLLGKTKGVQSAENYFSTLEESEKTKRTYGALLSCYCRDKKTDKATELFEKMKLLGFTSSLNYNNMMSLYLKIGQPEKVPMVAKEMEEMGIKLDLFAYSQLIDSYGTRKDFDAIDVVLQKMRNNKLEPDWFILGNIATIYVNGGLVEKAKVALKDLEKMNNSVHGREGFQTLIALCGKMNDSVGVYRAWEGLRENLEKPRNESYLVMILALSRLKDYDGLEKLFIEWERNCTFYDVRLANVMIETYLNRKMIDEANSLYESVIARGIKPNLRTVDLFTNYYLRDKNLDLAMKFLEIGGSTSGRERNIWFPYEKTVKMFLELIEEVKEEESAEKFYGIMKEIGRFDLIQKSKDGNYSTKDDE